MVIDSLFIGAFNCICDALGDKWYNHKEPSMSDGCVDVELSPNVKLEARNDNPMITIKFGRKTIFVPRCNFNEIKIY